MHKQELEFQIQCKISHWISNWTFLLRIYVSYNQSYILTKKMKYFVKCVWTIVCLQCCSGLLGSDLESGIGWPEPACMYHRYGHKALEYFIQFRSDLEKREKNHSVYIKSISSFNSLMHLLLKSSALILLMTALLKPWTFSWSADDASFQVQGNILRKPSQTLYVLPFGQSKLS